MEADGGVAAQICGDEKKALYTLLWTCSQSCRRDTIKQSKVCCDALDTAYEITRLVKFSPKRDAAFERIRAELQRMDENPISHATLNKFCPARWTVRGASVTSILNNYCALIELWEQRLETRLDPDVKGRIIGVKSQMMKLPFLFGLPLCDQILNITDNLSKTLQSQSMSAVEAQHIAGLTVTCLGSSMYMHT